MDDPTSATPGVAVSYLTLPEPIRLVDTTTSQRATPQPDEWACLPLDQALRHAGGNGDSDGDGD